MRIPKPVIREDRLMQYIQTQTAHSAGYVEGVLRDVEALKADALHELECGWWATGTVPEMMEAVRVIVRGTVDRATEGTP